MSFAPKEANALLAACHRRCCICHRFCGVKMELDHMLPKDDGGPDTIDTVTRVLAAWGAVVSTIAIIWNIRRDLVDRGKLRVVCYIGQVVGGLGPENSQLKLVYNVTNTGRRPILVTHIGGAFSKDRHFIVPTRGTMPRTLQPGEYLLEYSEDLSVLHQKPEAL